MLPNHNDSSHIKAVSPLGFFFFLQIYSSQGQGDNNSYTLITPNYLFLPPPQLSASVICYLGFSQPPLALSIQLNSEVFEENSCGFLEYSQCKVQPKLNYSPLLVLTRFVCDI